MSKFSGKQGKGAMARHRKTLREQAQTRHAAYVASLTPAQREAREQILATGTDEGPRMTIAERIEARKEARQFAGEGNRRESQDKKKRNKRTREAEQAAAAARAIQAATS